MARVTLGGLPLVSQYCLSVLSLLFKMLKVKQWSSMYHFRSILVWLDWDSNHRPSRLRSDALTIDCGSSDQGYLQCRGPSTEWLYLQVLIDKRGGLKLSGEGAMQFYFKAGPHFHWTFSSGHVMSFWFPPPESLILLQPIRDNVKRIWHFRHQKHRWSGSPSLPLLSYLSAMIISCLMYPPPRRHLVLRMFPYFVYNAYSDTHDLGQL